MEVNDALGMLPQCLAVSAALKNLGFKLERRCLFEVEQLYLALEAQIYDLTPFYLAPSSHELWCFKVNQCSIEPYIHGQVGEHESELGPGVLHEKAGQQGEGGGGEPEVGTYLCVGGVFLGGGEVHLVAEQKASIDQGV